MRVFQSLGLVTSAKGDRVFAILSTYLALRLSMCHEKLFDECPKTVVISLALFFLVSFV